jgi:hypothetical protein
MGYLSYLLPPRLSTSLLPYLFTLNPSLMLEEAEHSQRGTTSYLRDRKHPLLFIELS